MDKNVLISKLKKILPLALVGIVLLIIIISVISGYNSLVELNVSVDSKASDIEMRLQQRHDSLIQLMAAVEGLQDHEEDIYNAITAARAKYSGAQTTADYIEADQAETQAIISLLAVIEDNPDMVAQSAYNTFMNNVAGIESALAYARHSYNTSVENYNTEVRKFPRVMYAGMFGFQKELAFWKMADGAGEIPEINFAD